MIRGLIGSGTLVQGLRQELDASMIRSREIAHRVANASNSGVASFEASLQASLDAAPVDGVVDLEVEMVQLADEQIRYEAVSQLLQEMYGQIRSSIRGA